MCTTLATTPTAISPTRFHNSVHNAAAGYWTIGTGCRAASTALSAFDRSFAAGLLEAATQCAADGEAVLLVAFDVNAVGALASVTASARPARRRARARAGRAARGRARASRSRCGTARPTRPLLLSPAARALAGNGMADALPVFEALAATPTAPLTLPLAASLALHLEPIVVNRRDVVIAGGGLAGLSLALQLKQAHPGLDILVVERRRHPVPEATHKVGESTVEIGANYFGEVLGLKAHLQERQLKKFGFRFFSSEGRRDIDRVTEIGASRYLSVPSWQLDRGIFENFLAEEATRRGIAFVDGALVREHRDRQRRRRASHPLRA